MFGVEHGVERIAFVHRPTTLLLLIHITEICANIRLGLWTPLGTYTQPEAHESYPKRAMVVLCMLAGHTKKKTHASDK